MTTPTPNCPQTDGQRPEPKYSVEEARALSCELRASADNLPSVNDCNKAADMLTAYAERIATDEDVRVRFAKWAEENGYDVLSNDDLSAAAWHGYQAAHAALSGEVREFVNRLRKLSVAVIAPAPRRTRADERRWSRELDTIADALAKFAHQEPQA